MAGEDDSIVWGGSNTGLMRVIADEAEKQGCSLIGVTTTILEATARPSTMNMFVARDFDERKQLLLKHSDVLIILPGGIGTLDEALCFIELKKHSLHMKPVIFLNTRGFFSGLKRQLERSEHEGFLPVPLAQLVYFARSPMEAKVFVQKNYA